MKFYGRDKKIPIEKELEPDSLARWCGLFGTLSMYNGLLFSLPNTLSGSVVFLFKRGSNYSHKPYFTNGC